MHPLARLDHRFLWHPFTQMRDWLRQEPIVIMEGEGAVLRDVHGREYLDANSSIWTNLHGHKHPRINRAIVRQLEKIAHSSALGFANGPASLLAEQLIRSANPTPLRSGKRGNPQLSRVFFGDDGSTAMEVALKLAYECARRRGQTTQPRFLSLEGAYHGDTVGAVSLGHIDLFHKAYHGLLFPTDKVMAPYCYRCPYNRAKPDRADARSYRKCGWECLGKLEQAFKTQARKGDPYAGFVFEPLMQGAAGMIPQPAGWLAEAARLARAHGTLLIADEVMTGFGRTGISSRPTTALRNSGSDFPADSVSQHRAGTPRSNSPKQPSDPDRGIEKKSGTSLFACHAEGVQPDFMALAKGLTGGYLPMAATLTTAEVFGAFLGRYEEFKSFFHGHSFTGNQLGAAAGLESLKMLQSQKSLQARQRLQASLTTELDQLWKLPQVGDIRQVGLVTGVELVRNWRTREPFDLRQKAGIRVCEAMARQGVLTRPIGNVIVLMPPYCTTRDQLQSMISVLGEAIAKELAPQARSRRPR